MSDKIFFEIQSALPCPYRLLFFDEFFEPLVKTDEFKCSNIYMLTKVKRLRFDLSSTELINKRTLKTKILYGNDLPIDLTISFFDTIPIFKTRFGTKENFEDILSDDDDFYRCEIDTQNSSTDKIQFLQIAKTGQQLDFWLIPENIETQTDFINDDDFDNKPEVVYVGQSFQVTNRIKSHKTLHKAVSKLNDHEEIRIYFLTFKYGFFSDQNENIDFNEHLINNWLCEYENSGVYKDKISLVERFLIHYFRPVYNEQHVKSDITKDTLVKSILLNNNIDCITLNLDVEGKDVGFWSPKQQLKTNIASFDFLNPELGYQEGVLIP